MDDHAVAVGLVGAGPWADMMYAPMLAAGPETRLAGVWARRPEAAEALATKHGAPAFTGYEALLDACEAVAFAVPPDVQATMAARAARAGKALLLDKPIGLTLTEAERLTAAIDEAEVVSQLVLSNRYRPSVRAFLAGAAGFRTAGAQARQVGSVLEGPFTKTWRLEYGVVHDVGPHALDLVDAAVGPIEDLTAVGDPTDWVALTCRHTGGAISQVALSGSVPRRGAGRYTSYDLFGPDGSLGLDFGTLDAADGEAQWSTLRAEFAAAVRAGESHQLDVHRGLHLQRLIDRALHGLGR
jgi:predicted dehydrogenase